MILISDDGGGVGLKKEMGMGGFGVCEGRRGVK